MLFCKCSNTLNCLSFLVWWVCTMTFNNSVKAYNHGICVSMSSFLRFYSIYISLTLNFMLPYYYFVALEIRPSSSLLLNIHYLSLMLAQFLRNSAWCKRTYSVCIYLNITYHIYTHVYTLSYQNLQ